MTVRIRTIPAAAAHYKKEDPETPITEWLIRRLISSGELKCRKSGNRYLVNLDQLDLYLATSPEAANESDRGKLRKIRE